MNKYISYSKLDGDIGYNQYFDVTFKRSIGPWREGEKITCLSVDSDLMSLTEYDNEGEMVTMYIYNIV